MANKPTPRVAGPAALPADRGYQPAPARVLHNEGYQPVPVRPIGIQGGYQAPGGAGKPAAPTTGSGVAAPNTGKK